MVCREHWTPADVTLRRRTLLAASAAWLAGAAAARAASPGPLISAPPALPAEASLLVAGPAGGATDQWATTLMPALARVLPAGVDLHRTSAGGLDGVTGANQFDARADPDGGSLLLVPGDAALAWLAGDPRARFDAAHWLPVLAASSPGIVVGRATAAQLDGKLTLHLAAGSAAGPAMAALLALDLLGLPVDPVFGLADDAARRAAFASGAADLVLLHGAHVPTQLAAYAELGGHPIFALGGIDEAGHPGRDPLYPDLPTVTELHLRFRQAAPEGPLYDAWRAAASATQLAFGLMLPQLTPAALVSLWRRAGAQVAATADLQDAAAAQGLRPLPPAAAAASIACLAATPAALLELRSWLAMRWNYHPT
jgi:hypothetical protein